jgi:hypothetical protein
MVVFELVFDEVFGNRMDGIQWGLLAWDPDIITTRFLGFRPRKMKVGGTAVCCGLRNMSESGVTGSIEF